MFRTLIVTTAIGAIGAALAPTASAVPQLSTVDSPRYTSVSDLSLSPMSEQNAVQKAQDYLSISAFSRSGLIEQLEYSGFSTADATYAVSALTVDWNQQAAQKARDYLSISAFSRSGLIEQLEYSGFTPNQAEYGASAVGY